MSAVPTTLAHAVVRFHAPHLLTLTVSLTTGPGVSGLLEIAAAQSLGPDGMLTSQDCAAIERFRPQSPWRLRPEFPWPDELC